ncbi:L-2-hydroxyglutarate dehydrogenase, mitochondrial [Nymphon striatum]|nr:L-2-hydroxyglutarate dehydrogenase, mitochondrial [Nymphon striatum]
MGLTINVKKTKSMTISKKQQPPNCKLTIGEKSIEQKDKFNYLGNFLTADGKSKTAIRTRIAMAKNKFQSMKQILTNRNLSNQLKIRLLKCYIWPVLMYGCETWTITPGLKGNIEAAEMWFLRRMFKISYRDRVSNIRVLERAKTTRELLNCIQKRQLTFLGHSIRRGKLECLALEGRLEGKRSRGRQRTKFLDIMANSFEASGVTITVPEMLHCAYDRDATSNDKNYNLVIVGGGIIGAASARELSTRFPNLKIALVEKENSLAFHQSGRNSGVIHAGIYYTPGSLKAKLCVEGSKLTYEYCSHHNIPYKRCGKLIVAVNEIEKQRLSGLYERALQNDCPGIELINTQRIREIEPNCVGLSAIWSPNTGIIDYKAMNLSFGNDFENNGGHIYLNYEVNDMKLVDNFETSKYPLKIVSSSGTEIGCQSLITCGGLHADKLAKLSGCNQEPKIVPFRGEYLMLKPEKRDLVHTNIYPVPDPRFPFLGVHFTPRVDGEVWLGPNAVLAAKREGYGYLDINMKELIESLSYRGFQRMALKNVTTGVKELYHSFSMHAQVKQLKRFVPKLQLSDVMRGPSGVRAQALDRDGNLVDDFIFDGGSGPLGEKVLHVRNAPSPAATSSLAIAKMIGEKAVEKFQITN